MTCIKGKKEDFDFQVLVWYTPVAPKPHAHRTPGSYPPKPSQAGSSGTPPTGGEGGKDPNSVCPVTSGWTLEHLALSSIFYRNSKRPQTNFRGALEVRKLPSQHGGEASQDPEGGRYGFPSPALPAAAQRLRASAEWDSAAWVQ